MTALTLAIVGKTLFGADVEGEAAEIGAALTASVEAFPLANMPFSEILEKLPIPAALRFRRARRRLDATIYRMIAERRAAPGDRGDLLSMLLLATDTEGDGGGMSDLQLRDEAMTLFLAGHETTANALTWSLHLLSRHADAETRALAEVDALGADPRAEDLPRLPWIRAVLAESMRLYPPAWILGRRAKEAFDVGDFRIPARTIVLTSQFLVHRDARWWPRAEEFLPERWLDPTATAARPKFAWFPFGAGTRVCVGEQFAWMEGVLVLATILRRWRLRPAQPQPALDALITLRPRGGLRLTPFRRTDARRIQ
jgi:cytochrome P450